MNTFGIVIGLFTGSVLLYAIWILWNEYSAAPAHITPPPMPYLSSLQQPALQDLAWKKKTFEEFVVSRFDRQHFQTLNWQTDRSYAGLHQSAYADPDLVFEFRAGTENVPFGICCSWHQDFKVNNVPEIDARYLRRQAAFQDFQYMDVFLVVGIGGFPHEPENLYIVPLRCVPQGTASLQRDFIENFRKQPDRKLFLDTERMMLV